MASETLQKTPGQVLRELRRRRALSQVELSKRSGVAQGTIVNIELDRLDPQGRTLRKLAVALDVGVEEFRPAVVVAPAPVNPPSTEVQPVPREQLPLPPEFLIGTGQANLLAASDAPVAYLQMTVLALETLMAKYPDPPADVYAVWQHARASCLNELRKRSTG